MLMRTKMHREVVDGWRGRWIGLTGTEWEQFGKHRSREGVLCERKNGRFGRSNTEEC